MKEIGEYLREIRIQNGVGIEEAAEDLNMSTSQIENVESGNIRAFRDVFTLKELVKEYSKYLGLDPDRVLDEFNDFMFEHTSKISLDDILEAKALKQQKEAETKISSPYTKIPKKKRNYKPLLITLGILVGVSLIIYLVIKITDQVPKINQELLGIESVVEYL